MHSPRPDERGPKLGISQPREARVAQAPGRRSTGTGEGF